jgi:hypothetical protein
VLGQGGGEVRVMVLDADRLQPQLERVLGREVLRVQVAGERERVLELGADREQRGRRRDRERRRHEPARAPHDPPAAHHGVVHARVDRAVVQEEKIRDGAQPLHRILVRERTSGTATSASSRWCSGA